MEKSYPEIDESIDLIKILHLIWLGKWIVIGTALIFVIVLFIFLQTRPPLDFIATTKINPIASTEELKYSRLNTFLENYKNLKHSSIDDDDESKTDQKDIKKNKKNSISIGALENFMVNSDVLFNLYIEQINVNKLFEEAIVEHGLINRKDYNNNKSFTQAVAALAARIKLEDSPTIDEDPNESDKFSKIIFSHSDENKWRDILFSVHSKAEDNVKKHLISRFNTAIDISKQIKDFEIDDAIVNLDNSLSDYDTNIIFLLEYLGEQAAIARALGIEKSHVEAQMFSSRNVMLNMEFDIPFYLKGFEAIDKEIELIKNRTEKKAFIAGYNELEKEIRSLKQDKTVERAIEYFNLTPLAGSGSFVAANMQIESTKFNYNNVGLMAYVISALVGAFLAILYLIISNAFRDRDKNLQLS